MTLDDRGAVIVVLPQRAPESLAAELVERHRRWIASHQRRIAEERRILAARPELGAGRTLTLRGLPHDVFVDANEHKRGSSVALEAHSPAVIVVRRSPADVRPVAAILESWLRREARRDLDQRVTAYGAEMDLEPRRISVRDQRSRWGSASRRGTLSFSWRLVLCPPEIPDYVVVHELAHLRHAGHGTRFWSLVRRHAPSAEHHRRWLRLNEARLRHALD